MQDNAVKNQIDSSLKKADGIEILVDWAKSGKIDPWNIDIVQVTDMFLQKLIELKENNLRFTGRILFFAAVLLKLKSNFLEGLDPFKEEPEFEEPIDELDENFDDNADHQRNSGINNVVSLEKVLTRRTSSRLNRSRKVTLDDLIKQIRILEEIEDKKAHKAREERIKQRRSYTHFTPDDIVEMAHEEYIEDEIEKLQNTLTHLFETDSKVELNDLLKTGMDKITTYIALLFLASRSRIELVQDEFYSDLFIVNEVN